MFATMKRRTLIELAAASSLLAACTRVGGPSETAGARKPYTKPHVLRWADGEDPVGLNPLSNVHAVTSWLAELWGGWLFRNSAEFEPVPELCTTVPTVENGLLSRDLPRVALRRLRWRQLVPALRDVVNRVERLSKEEQEALACFAAAMTQAA